MNNNSQSQPQKRVVISAILAVAAFGLAYAPLPGIEQEIVVVSGTELAEPLKQLETRFEQQYPNINLDLKFQGSQDIVNNYIDQKNDFTPTVLIPASQGFLEELSQRWQAQNQTEPYYKSPQAIAKTFLVGVAWLERGKVLFPNNQFSWSRLEEAMNAKTWNQIGGSENWGSFDFVMTDPTRSNSGQLTLSLWLNSKQGNSQNFNTPTAESLFKTIGQSVYQPPRSTDILLQEFIARGPNDADVITVYESIALHRWQQAKINQNEPYQIYYLNPTIETVATAAIVRENVSSGTANAAEKFLDFLREPEQQEVFVQYGFRPVNPNVNLESVVNSPWQQNIPGAEVNPKFSTIPTPQPQELREIQRLWQRVSP
ncbi:MAG: substrate-binding domain-containing protein [Cyanobacteriota bacterium]|nr:substrate-binding domain-containing protein [Cyanobacteriota bacterium]